VTPEALEEQRRQDSLTSNDRPLTLSVLRASEHGFTDGDHLIMDGHEYTAEQVYDALHGLHTHETLKTPVSSADSEQIGVAIRTVSQNCDMTDLARRGDWLIRELRAKGFRIVRDTQETFPPINLSSLLCKCGVALPAPGRPCALCGAVNEQNREGSP
jgi:hypothetical protein